MHRLQDHRTGPDWQAGAAIFLRDQGTEEPGFR